MLLNALSVGEKLSTGSITFFMGMVITFIVLGLLIGIIMIFNYLLNKLDFKKSKSKPEIVPVLETNVKNTEVTKDETVNGETLEAVNSAIKLFMTQNNEKPHERYTVKSVKRVKLGEEI